MIIQIENEKCNNIQIWEFDNEPVASVKFIDTNGWAPQTYTCLRPVAYLLDVSPKGATYMVDDRFVSYADICNIVSNYYINNAETWMKEISELV